MEYLDFEIRIGTATDGQHPVVTSSPAGEATGTLRLGLGPLELENRLQALQIALLRSATMRRRVGSADEQAVQTFGRELFGALFQADILSNFDVSRIAARHQEKGLRIKLRFDSTELSGLPWEFLYDPRQADYLSRSLITPVIRYPEVSDPPDALLVTPPLRILGLIVSPTDLDPLDVEHERQRVDDALTELQADGRLELVWLQGNTPEALMRALNREHWHIFHFIGHGGYDPAADEGFIVLADDQGRATQVSAGDLGRLLGDHMSMRLAVLNSCEGARLGTGDIFASTAAEIIRKRTPAVVAMQYEITDVAAIQFSRSFYSAVADGLPVDAAVSSARTAMSMTKSLEWGTPVLYMHARDGQLFRIDQTLRPPSPIEKLPDLPPPEPPEAPAPVVRPRKFCVYCGSALIVGNRFCTACGKPTT
jgi:hypothetical protein